MKSPSFDLYYTVNPRARQWFMRFPPYRESQSLPNLYTIRIEFSIRIIRCSICWNAIASFTFPISTPWVDFVTSTRTATFPSLARCVIDWTCEFLNLSLFVTEREKSRYRLFAECRENRGIRVIRKRWSIDVECSFVHACSYTFDAWRRTHLSHYRLHSYDSRMIFTVNGQKVFQLDLWCRLVDTNHDFFALATNFLISLQICLETTLCSYIQTYNWIGWGHSFSDVVGNEVHLLSSFHKLPLFRIKHDRKVPARRFRQHNIYPPDIMWRRNPFVRSMQRVVNYEKTMQIRVTRPRPNERRRREGRGPAELLDFQVNNDLLCKPWIRNSLPNDHKTGRQGSGVLQRHQWIRHLVAHNSQPEYIRTYIQSNPCL